LSFTFVCIITLKIQHNGKVSKASGKEEKEASHEMAEGKPETDSNERSFPGSKLSLLLSPNIKDLP
jgi:hypothetical protein